MSESRDSSEPPTRSESAEPVDKAPSVAVEDDIVTDIPYLHTAKRLKVEARKLDGMQRELYSLMGENTAPVAITTDSKFKTRPDWQQRVTPWQLADFSPKQGLELQHWVRTTSLVEGISGDRFAKFNTKPDVPQWSDEQYKLFENPKWSLDETRYLFDLANDYDLRWLVIADRYTFKRPAFDSEEVEMQDQERASDVPEKETIKGDETTKTNTNVIQTEKADKSTELTASERSGNEGENIGGSSNEEAEAKESKQDTDPKQADEKAGDETNAVKNSGQNETKVQKRHNKSGRTIEELKERYYEVCRALIRNKPLSTEFGLSPHDEELLTAMNFDRSTEEKRKAHLERLLSRNPKEVAEEEALVLEARRLEALSGKMYEERQRLLRVLDTPSNLSNANHSKIDLSSSHGVGQLLQDLNNDKGKRTLVGANGTGPTKSSDKESERPNGSEPSAQKIVSKILDSMIHRKLTTREELMLGISYVDPGSIKSAGVYLRSTRLTPIRQSLLPKVRAITSELGLPLRPVMPTQKMCAQYETLYQSINILLEAKKVQDKLEMEVGILKKAKEPTADSPAA